MLQRSRAKDAEGMNVRGAVLREIVCVRVGDVSHGGPETESIMMLTSGRCRRKRTDLSVSSLMQSNAPRQKSVSNEAQER